MNPTPPSKVVYIIVIATAMLALIGMSALCFALYYHAYADPAIITAIISLTSSLTGSLTTLLIGRNMQQMQPPQDVTVTTNPSKVELTQPEKKD